MLVISDHNQYWLLQLKLFWLMLNVININLDLTIKIELYNIELKYQKLNFH
jgi:hypothetical protein